MSRKHNTKHDRRGPSLYPERLAARGISSAGARMPFIDRHGRKRDTIDAVLRGERDKD